MTPTAAGFLDTRIGSAADSLWRAGPESPRRSPGAPRISHNRGRCESRRRGRPAARRSRSSESDREPSLLRRRVSFRKGRLSRLVDDLLNLARADAGHVRLQSEQFYLNDLLAECCRSAQSLAAARGIALECRPAEDAPFRGDEELLRRLVMNLLDNA